MMVPSAFRTNVTLAPETRLPMICRSLASRLHVAAELSDVRPIAVRPPRIDGGRPSRRRPRPPYRR